MVIVYKLEHTETSQPRVVKLSARNLMFIILMVAIRMMVLIVMMIMVMMLLDSGQSQDF